ncbi:MAG: hypothetical protein Kow00121_14470 [Elainellaceae cyanobacterium]
MSYPPPPSSRGQQPPYRYSSPIRRQSETWFESAGRLVLGFGLMAVALAWVIPKPSALEATTETQPAPDSPEFSKFDIQNPIQNLAETIEQASNQASYVSEVADATVCVKGIMPDGTGLCASGVSIDPELAGIEPGEGAVIVTNYHVVANTGDRPPVQLKGEGETFNAQVIEQSPAMDLALLLVPGKEFPIAELAETAPTEQIAVRAIGFPNNGALTVKESRLLGLIQECLAIAPCLAIQQNTITHGNSGGPLEADGKVIGINQGETIQEIAIPVEQVHQFLAGEIPDPGSVSPYGGGYPGSYPGGPGGGYPGGPYPGGYPPPAVPRGAMPFPPPGGGYPPPRW